MSKRLMILASALAFLMGVADRAYSADAGQTSQWGIVLSPCAWCGATNDLEVHHIRPQHIAPELAHDTNNIVCLCRRDGKGCHYYIGHHGRGWDFVFTNVMAAIRLTAESNITAAAQTNLILKPETNSLKPELKLEEGL